MITDILKRLTCGEKLHDYEARLRCKDGSIKTVLIDSSVLWEDGKFIHTQCFTRDMTQRKRAEQRLAIQYFVTRVLVGAPSIEAAAPGILQTICQNADWDLSILWRVNARESELGFVESFHKFTARECELIAGSRQRTFRKGLGLPGQVWAEGRPLWWPEVADNTNFPRAPFAAADGFRTGAGFPIRLGKEILGVIEFFSRERREVDRDFLEMLDAVGAQIGQFIERTKAGEALRQTNERLTRVLEVETVGVMFWDLTTGCLVDANDTFLKMMGYSRADVESRSLTWQKLTPPDYHDLSRAEVAKFMTTGRVGPYEKEYFHKDGSRQWLLFAGSSLGNNQVVEFCVDISARKKIEQALRESEERYRATFENAAIGIAHVGLDGRWLRFNDAVCAITGYSRDELRRMTFTDITHPDDLDRDWQQARELIAGEIGRYSMEKRYIRKDGSTVWVMLTVSLMRDAAAQPLHLVSVIENIDEKKRAREILEQTVAQRTASLREAVEQMEEFSYSVSHDLRAPLRAMNSYAGVLLEEYGAELDGTARGYLEKIQRSADRMNRLTQDVLTYSRVARTQVQLEPIALEKLVKDILHQYSYLQSPAADIEITGPLLDVLGHETTLGQSIANLLNNAVKFIAPGIKPRVRIWSERQGKSVRVWFQDNGIGIKPQHQGRVFQMFERVHPEGKYEGTGIGLTIVRKAVEKMGGKVGVESDGQNGSRFWIELRSAEEMR